ncbi:DUF1611 domain-containing protein [Cyanobium sp. Morenito 9A2]|uniref:DUF1611 domain-containing protein n=1 Tax=Cyanobium sp. Morenito 9A2 TaxID=2823718 RepID=UPI0020CE7238|nr:DUF1611 domain-containing protein [Cyanobium sp. Morenito 9A2]MCP9848227.1 DUF1611 domain-containing protein [Cyanobium sp. Morenito 9A2]
MNIRSPLDPQSPVVLMQHGGLDNLSGKTGLALLRYRSGPIVAVVDPVHAGVDLETLTGIRRAVPVVASLAEALPLGPEVAVVGLAPSGGRLPEPLRSDLRSALAAGLNVASGLHTRLGDDPELAGLLIREGQWIWDLRQEPEGLQVAAARAAALPGRRILAVGSDMAVGKMSACLELRAAALARGLDARFVGTGQAGILIAGTGVPLDAVRVDYAAGAVEQAVLEVGQGLGSDGLLLVEGQGSLCHPGSSATLPLVRGSQPTELLLVHRAGQERIRERSGALPVAIPPLGQLVELLGALAALARPMGASAGPPRVRAIALNTGGLDGAAASAAIEACRNATGLPTHDPVRHGGEGLLDALLRR